MMDWKCIAVLKGDGSQSQADSATPPIATPAGLVATTTQTNTARYYKLGTIANPSQVPRH